MIYFFTLILLNQDSDLLSCPQLCNFAFSQIPLLKRMIHLDMPQTLSCYNEFLHLTEMVYDILEHICLEILSVDFNFQRQLLEYNIIHALNQQLGLVTRYPCFQYL